MPYFPNLYPWVMKTIIKTLIRDISVAVWWFLAQCSETTVDINPYYAGSERLTQGITIVFLFPEVFPISKSYYETNTAKSYYETNTNIMKLPHFSCLLKSFIFCWCIIISQLLNLLIRSSWSCLGMSSWSYPSSVSPEVMVQFFSIWPLLQAR